MGRFIKTTDVGVKQSDTSATFSVVSNLVRETTGRYVLEFFIPENIESGNYILSSFVVFDNAGNRTLLQADERRKYYFESHPIEVIKVTIQ